MRTVYVSDDGKEFKDKLECEHYEWLQRHPALQKYVHIWDGLGYPRSDILSEETYDRAQRVLILSDEALKDLQELSEYTGFCCYSQINELGTWEFDVLEGRYVQTEKVR